jgi:hypothetical protein
MTEKMDNQLGWVTSLSIANNRNMIDVSTVGGGKQYIAGQSFITGSLEFTAAYTGGVQELLQDWLRNGITRPQYNKEFMCLYCTSPNSIERTHCKKCGAPRSFVLG